MALDVGEGVAWLERAEEAVVLGHVQSMRANGIRLPEKLLRGFEAMMVVLRNHPPVGADNPVPPPSSAQCGDRDLPYCRGQLEDLEVEVRRLIRGYEGIPTEVPWCVLRSLKYYGEGMPTAGESYRAHTAGPLNSMCHNQEALVRRVCYHAVAEVQKEENVCPRFVWHRQRQLAAGKKEHMWRVLQAVLPGEEYMLPTNRTCGRRGPVLMLDVDFGGAAHGSVRRVMKEGVSLEVLHLRRKDMKKYRKAGLHHAEFYRDQGVVKWGVYKWMMRQGRGQEARARWDKRMRKMWKERVAQWGIQRKKPRRGRGAGAVQEKVLDRGERGKARPGILLCAPLGLQGRRGKVQSTSGQPTMSMRIWSGKTTSCWGQDRGTSAGNAPRRRGRYRGWC